MKFRSLVLAVSILIALVGITQVWAQDTEDLCEGVYLLDGWARASVEGAPNSAAYGTLVNLSDVDDVLVAASTPSAEVVELHEMTMGTGDVMQMRPVEGGIAVAANNFAQLKPGGLHIMLINLVEPLLAGEMIELTLTFENAGDLVVTLPIKEAMAMGDMAMGGMGEGEMAMHGHDMSAPVWDEACSGLHVLNAWARPANAAMPTSAAYALLVNLTDTADTLVSASSPAAEFVELHEMLMGDGDVMTMQQVEGGIDIPSGGVAVLEPGGLHIMLISLTGELVDGDSIELTLSFANNEDIVMTVPVREPEVAETDGMGSMD